MKYNKTDNSMLWDKLQIITVDGPFGPGDSGGSLSLSSYRPELPDPQSLD
jgi:hypothetical protein